MDTQIIIVQGINARRTSAGKEQKYGVPRTNLASSPVLTMKKESDHKTRRESVS